MSRHVTKQGSFADYTLEPNLAFMVFPLSGGFYAMLKRDNMNVKAQFKRK